LAAALAAIPLSAIPAFGADKGGDRPHRADLEVRTSEFNWTGPYAGVWAGLSTLPTDMELEGVNLSLGPDAITGGLTLGADWQLVKAAGLGIFGSYGWGDRNLESVTATQVSGHALLFPDPDGAGPTPNLTQWKTGNCPTVLPAGTVACFDKNNLLNADIIGPGTASTKIRFGSQWELGARAFILPSASTMLYLGAKYVSADTSVGDLAGIGPLLGLETVVGPNLTLKLEGGWVRFEDVTIRDAAGVTTQKLEPNELYVRLGVNWRPTLGWTN